MHTATNKYGEYYRSHSASQILLRGRAGETAMHTYMTNVLCCAVLCVCAEPQAITDVITVIRKGLLAGSLPCRHAAQLPVVAEQEGSRSQLNKLVWSRSSPVPQIQLGLSGPAVRLSPNTARQVFEMQEATVSGRCRLLLNAGASHGSCCGSNVCLAECGGGCLRGGWLLGSGCAMVVPVRACFGAFVVSSMSLISSGVLQLGRLQSASICEPFEQLHAILGRNPWAYAGTARMMNMWADAGATCGRMGAIICEPFEQLHALLDAHAGATLCAHAGAIVGPCARHVCSHAGATCVRMRAQLVGACRRGISPCQLSLCQPCYFAVGIARWPGIYDPVYI
jgi:hypothetical protein